MFGWSLQMLKGNGFSSFDNNSVRTNLLLLTYRQITIPSRLRQMGKIVFHIWLAHRDAYHIPTNRDGLRGFNITFIIQNIIQKKN